MNIKRVRVEEVMEKKISTKHDWRMKDAAGSDRCWWWLASLFMAFILLIIATACAEELSQTETGQEGLPATIRLEVMPDAAAQAQTRADEKAIKDLHVLVYNSKGELIGQNYGTSSTLTVNARSGSGCTLYAITNTGNATLFDGVATTEAKLKAMKTAALTAWDGLDTAPAITMVGSKTGITIQPGNSSSNKIGNLLVTRMVAKVTLNIKTKEGSGITIKDYQVCSLPEQSYYVPNTTDGATDWIEGTKTTVNAASETKTFLMYENRKGIVSTITDQKDKGEGKAPQNSTYVVINGEANGYKATWRVYLGENNTSDFNIKRNNPYTYNITLNRPGIDGADTRVEIENIVSNCYMIFPGSNVTIPVIRANESFLQIGTARMSEGKCIQLENNTTWTASLVWETSIGLVTLSENTGTGPTGHFKVTATHGSNQGNAVIAIKNSSNQILWSWHIWVTTYDGSATFQHNGNAYNPVFMDRNLGAISTTPGDLNSCGLYYQWGRKDPTPGLGQIGGRWNITDNDDPIRVYNSKGVSYAISKAATNTTTSNNLSNAIRNPDTHYYYYVEALSDWFTANNASLQNGSLWGGKDITLATPAPKTVFDPCPNGWRVPPYLNNISPFKGMPTVISFINYGADFGVNGYFPASGWRAAYSGNIYGAGQFCHYWSASPTGVKSGSFTIFSNGTAETLATAGRSAAISVRCIKE